MPSDTIYTIDRFPHDDLTISAWCELLFGTRFEVSILKNGTKVIIHPRPRELTEEEQIQLESVLRAAKPFELSVDKTQIRADGEDYATVMIQSTGDSVLVLVRDQAVNVPLQDGVGTLEIAAGFPTLEPIEVRAVDPLIFGFAKVEVTAI